MRRAPFVLPRQFAAALAVLGLAAAAAALVAQEPVGRFGTSVDVRVVNVEVVVTDGDGNPVTGLTRDDFELRVNGRPVAISNFYAGERTSARDETVVAAPVATVAPAVASAPAAAVPAAQPPRLVVWIDDLSLLPAHRNRVLRELSTFLEEQRGRNAQILIARFDRSIEIVRPFEAGERPLAPDIDDLRRRAASGVMMEVGRRQTMQEIRQIYGDTGCVDVDRMTAAANRFAQPATAEWENQLEQLSRWLVALGGLEGRKALLYVSGGVPLDPGFEPFQLIGELCGSTLPPTTGLTNELRRVTRAANAAGVAFYTLSAGGLRVDVSAEDGQRTLSAGTAFLSRANLSDPLNNLASETGGRALLEANDVTPLIAGLRSDLESYYSLGFEPVGEPDGRQHRIEVRVAREGLRVRHRAGFTDRTAAERVSDRLQASLRFGGESDPLGVVVEAGDVKRRDGKTATVPVRIVVPATKLVFLPDEGGESARVEITLVASDAEGRVSPEQRRTLTVPRAKLAAELGGAFLRFPLELTLRQGPAVLAVAVRDLNGASEAIVRREILVR